MKPPLSLEEQEDATFRAQLAPLASKVLPDSRDVFEQTVPVVRQHFRARPRWRGYALALATLVAMAGLPAGFWMFGPRTTLADLAAALVGNPATPAPQAMVSVPAASDPLIRILLQRGNAALTSGDITAARLLYQRAADAGSAEAARMLGKTYDIQFLLEIGARGPEANQALAAEWYARATALAAAQSRAFATQPSDGHSP